MQGGHSNPSAISWSTLQSCGEKAPPAARVLFTHRLCLSPWASWRWLPARPYRQRVHESSKPPPQVLSFWAQLHPPFFRPSFPLQLSKHSRKKPETLSGSRQSSWCWERAWVRACTRGWADPCEKFPLGTTGHDPEWPTCAGTALRPRHALWECSPEKKFRTRVFQKLLFLFFCCYFGGGP